MKVLYIVSRPIEINASSSVRNKATIQGLLEAGCVVRLVTTQPDHNHPAYDSSMSISGLKTDYIQQGSSESVVRIGRKLKFLAPLKKLVYQFLMHNQIYDNLVTTVDHVNKLTIDLGDVDCIISSSDPKSSHLLAKKLIELHPEFHGRWIQIWGDPFIGDITFENKQINHIKKEEHMLVSAADQVVYVSPLTLIEQQKLYPDCAAKMTYEPIPYVQTRVSELRDLTISRPIEIAYCGDYLSSVRNVMPLYDFVKQSDRYHLTICGTTDLHLKQTAQITIYPRVGRDKVTQIEEKADILVHLSNLKGTQIPGKIYQYAGTNKPILFILDGEKTVLRNLFGQYKRFCFADNNIQQIGHCLSDIVEGKTVEIKNVPLDDFTARRIALRLVKWNAEEHR